LPRRLKKKYNVYLSEKVVAEAKELGLNISRICENSLKSYINALRKSGISSLPPRTEEE
jgi:post-segregation antitoxin (ccd killing protein)